MAKRRTEKASPAPELAAAELAVVAPSGGWWPEEFLAPKPTTIIVVAGLVATFFLGYLAAVNGLVGFKQFFAYCLGLQNPLDIGVVPSSSDAGFVLIGLVWVCIGIAIHPAAGLAVLLLLRPWIDGYSFKTDNMYFVWGFAACFIVWGVRTVFLGAPVRAWRPALLFAAFPLIGFLLAGKSYYYYDTYRALILWTTYVFTFFLVANLGASPKIRRILIAAILLTVVAEAVYAVMQFRYVMPFLRNMMLQDPEFVRTQLGGDPNSPELTRRFNINRAWGTILFPNALAAFLITWIPLQLACLWNNLQVWRALSATGGTPSNLSAGQRRRIVGICVGIWFVGVITIYLLFQFPIIYLPPGQLPAYLGSGMAEIITMVLALLPAAGIYLLAISRGLPTALAVGRTALFGLGLLISFYGLGLTYSRGGFLALAMATIFGIVLLYLPSEKILARIPAFVRRLALPVVASAALMLFVAQAPQAPPSPQVNTGEVSTSADTPRGDASDAVSVEGQNVSAKDLVDPATFRARFGYWKVALKVFADNPWTGVGLGAFSWSYPNYQYLGAGDVQIAHNGYLQAFCETGILGGLVLIAFWKLIVITGALRALQESDPALRRLYLGILVGLVAFLLHSFIDINFAHPTLMVFAVVAAGLVYTLAPESSSPSRLAHLAVLPTLVVVALCCGMALRVFVQDASLNRAAMLNVADERDAGTRYTVAEHFLEKIIVAAQEKKRPPFIYFASARILFPEVKDLTALGGVFAQTSQGKLQALRNGDTVPENALFLVTRPYKALDEATKATLKSVAELESIDARFPYNGQLALQISRYYFLICKSNFNDPSIHIWVPALENAVRWAEVAVRRNPHFAGGYAQLANTHLLRAAFAKGKPNQDDFTAAWSALKKAASLTPVSPDHWGGMVYTGNQLADAYDRVGQKDKASAIREEARLAGEHAGWLITQRVRLGIDPTPRPAKQGGEGAKQP